MKDLTPKQRLVMDAIADGIKANLRPPTVRWLMESIGAKSTNTIVCKFVALKQKGWLVRRGGTHLTQGAKRHYRLIFGDGDIDEFVDECVRLIANGTDDIPVPMRPGAAVAFGMLADLLREFQDSCKEGDKDD